MSDPVKQIESLLHQHNFRLIRETKHRVYRNPAGQIFVCGSTPSDYRAAKNALANLRHVIESPAKPEIVAVSEFEKTAAFTTPPPRRLGHNKQKRSKSIGIYWEEPTPTTAEQEAIKKEQQERARKNKEERRARKLAQKKEKEQIKEQRKQQEERERRRKQSMVVLGEVVDGNTIAFGKFIAPENGKARAIIISMSSALKKLLGIADQPYAIIHSRHFFFGLPSTHDIEIRGVGWRRMDESIRLLRDDNFTALDDADKARGWQVAAILNDELYIHPRINQYPELIDQLATFEVYRKAEKIVLTKTEVLHYEDRNLEISQKETENESLCTAVEYKEEVVA